MFVNPTNHPIFIPIAINRRGAFKYNPPPLFSLPLLYILYISLKSSIERRSFPAMFPLMPRKISQRNQSVPFSWNETRYRFFSSFRSPNRFKKNELIIRLYDRGRKVVREEFRSNWISRNEKKKGGEKTWNFYSVSQRNGQFMKKEGRGEWDRLNFARRGKLVFCRCSPHNRPPQNGRGNVEMKFTAGTVSGWPAIGSRFRFGRGLRSKTFRPNRKIRLPDCTRGK